MKKGKENHMREDSEEKENDWEGDRRRMHGVWKEKSK